MNLPQYYILGIHALKLVETLDGGMDLLAYDLKSEQFVSRLDLLDRVLRGSSDAQEIGEKDFLKAVEKLKRGEEL